MSKARVGHWVSIGGCRGSVSAPFAFRCVNSLSPKQTDPTGGRPTIALGAGGRSLARDGQHQHLQGPRFMQKCLGYLGSWFGVLRAIQPDCFLVATAVLLGLASLHLADQDRIIHDMTDQARHISVILLASQMIVQLKESMPIFSRVWVVACSQELMFLKSLTVQSTVLQFSPSTCHEQVGKVVRIRQASALS